VADVLRVLPDVQKPAAPETLVNLDDNTPATTISSLPDPATPPLLGLLDLVNPRQGDDLLWSQAL
jgi:hypothetical protein